MYADPYFCGSIHDGVLLFTSAVHRRSYKDLGNPCFIAGIVEVWDISVWSSCALFSSPPTAHQKCPVHAYHSRCLHIRGNLSSLLLTAKQFPPPSHRRAPIFIPWDVDSVPSVHKVESPPEDHTSWHFRSQLTWDRSARIFSCPTRPPGCTFP
jgi:hypothetical protein